MKESLRKRIGTFEITREFVLDAPDAVLAVMSKVIVVRCEFMYHKNTLEYQAVSPHFDEVPDIEIPPRYSVKFDIEEPTDTSTGSVTAHFVRES
ncbi:hypothetical protein B1748_23655 [Paenibacillus sp. MY03]|uniref:hypothetical protein n=1 Tax=Paenibacillus sp. MY03 TaxID=302980 RepID=UPI000B3D4E9A|nr:hypothetical protein [Paenibacillus sp. MY03]OUS73006.1 hypothetical protein B1748_23655 [Paenibacillus sp. MY03]